MKSTNHHQPPKWAKSFLRWFCKPGLLEHIEGDLEESFEERLKGGEGFLSKKQIRTAKWQYILEVLFLFRPGITKSFPLLNAYVMNFSILKNYVKMGFRQIARHKLFSLLNIAGLAFSLSVCLLIIMMVEEQFSYDEFHEQKDRIYRVTSDLQKKGFARPMQNASAPWPVALELDSLYPGVEHAVRIINTRADVKRKDEIIPMEGLFVDPSFLDVFSFGWLRGNQQLALEHAGHIVITEESKATLFGEANALGEVLKLGELGSYIISGIIPNPPRRSHIQFHFLLPVKAYAALEEQGKKPSLIHNWDNIWMPYVYVMLDESADEAYLNEALAEIAQRKYKDDEEKEAIYMAHSISEVVPGKMIANELGFIFPAMLLWILMGLGGIVMLLACVNYTNLSIARSLKRAKEIGVRKVIGAKRRQIVFQFLIEAILISLMALGLGIVLLEYLIPSFLSLHPFLSRFFEFRRSPEVYAWFVGFSVGIGIIAGLIPAVHLSSYKAVDTLKQLKNVKWFSYLGVRKFLVMVQFTLSLMFILSTILLYRQQKLLLSIDFGFQTDQIVNVELQGVEYEELEQRMAQVKGVAQISGSNMIPGTGSNTNTCMAYESDTLLQKVLDYNFVSKNYLENLGIQLVEGESFPLNASRQSEQFILLNEQATRNLGFECPGEAVGQYIDLVLCEDNFGVDTSSSNALIITGIIEDIHYVAVAMDRWDDRSYGLRYKSDELRYANVKLGGTAESIQATLDEMETVWHTLEDQKAFRYSFFDEQVADQFRVFNMAASVIGFLSFLAVVIACMGLLGMVVYAVEGRIQEVSIRKILGAGEGHLIWLMSRSFVFLLAVAILVAVPASYFLNAIWLETYSNHVSLDLITLLLGMAIVGILSGLAIISQTYRAAKANPADQLRAE